MRHDYVNTFATNNKRSHCVFYHTSLQQKYNIHSYSHTHTTHASNTLHATHTTPPQVCASCTSSCSPGRMLSGNCDGTGQANSVSCTQCTAGTYSPGGTSTACMQCPGGFYSDIGASGCTPCPAGTYSAPGSLKCTPCTEWECSPGEYRSVCTGSDPGTCSPVPLWTQLVVSPLYAEQEGDSSLTRSSEVRARIHATSAAETSTRSTAAYLTSINEGMRYATTPAGNVVYTSNSQIPKLSNHAAAATSDGMVFLFGGRLAANSDDASTVERSSRLYALHLAHASAPAWWQVLAGKDNPVPPAREMHGMAAVGDHVYVSGGAGGSSESGTLLGDVWKYKVLLNAGAQSDGLALVGSWVACTGAALPSRMSQHQMVGTPDAKLWIFGGSMAGGKVVDRLMSLDTKDESASWKVHVWNLKDLARQAAAYASNATLLLPPARSQHGMVAVGYRIYVSAQCMCVCVYITRASMESTCCLKWSQYINLCAHCTRVHACTSINVCAHTHTETLCCRSSGAQTSLAIS